MNHKNRAAKSPPRTGLFILFIRRKARAGLCSALSPHRIF